MAKKLKVGDVLRGYRVTRVFGPGMMAISYGAQSASGQKVFLKQYKSPAPSVVWYDDFIAYQKELSARVRDGAAAHFAVRQVDAFEERWGGPCYFQAYEFVENGADLQHMIDESREKHRATGVSPTRDPAVWARHVTWAKVLMAGVAALHESRIVHADLKPPNAYLIADPTIGSGYQLKLIDMDFSLLADKRAPWHGFQGYVGSDNYRSPEHLTRKSVPLPASDVFTCGLMLYELLAGDHPYWREDQAEYAALALAHAAKPPVLAGRMPAPADNAEVSRMLHRCLSPDPAARPTAVELRAVLSGRGPRVVASSTAASASPTAWGRSAGAATRPAGTAATGAAAGKPVASDSIELVASGGSALRVRIRTELGRALLRQFGDDSAFWDDRQCVLERNAGGQWLVSPIASTTNETLLNGVALTAPHPLRDGDAIAVGRQSKGIVKMPLTVRGR